MLKYPIYIQSITNLSDARYCAGMGVDFLGFCLDEKVVGFIDNTTYQGIKGWIEGVKIVGEFATYPSKSELSELEVDYLALTDEYDPNQNQQVVPLISIIDIEDLPEIFPPAGNFIVLISKNSAFKLSDKEDFILNLCTNFKVFIGIGIDENSIETIAEKYKPYGFSLKGGNEIAPGLNNFEGLAEILELIEL